MVEQLGTVAYKLIKDAVSPANNAAGRRSRIMDKMDQLKAAIDNFHEFRKDKEKRLPQKDREVVEWLVDVKDIYYEVIDLCKELRKEEMAVQKGGNGIPLSCSNGSLKCQIQRDGTLKMADQILSKANALKGKKEKGEREERPELKEGVVQGPKPPKGEREERLEPKEGVVQGPKPPNGTSAHDKKEPNGTSVLDKKEPEIYSRSTEQRRLITWMHHSLDEVQLISITGPSGIGKSALARRVYDQVKGDFDLPAWVSVSEEFNLLRIVRDFVVRVTSKKINKMELAMESLSQRVRESIKKKKFLLVLDGLQEHKDFGSEWKRLNDLFNCGGPGCVILVTTHQDHDVVKKIK